MGEVKDCCQLSNSACLQLGPHVCEWLSWRRIQAGVPESDSEASPKLLKMGCVNFSLEKINSASSAALLAVKLDIVDGTVNVTKCIGMLLKCVVVDLLH